jgi:hypothetical protein
MRPLATALLIASLVVGLAAPADAAKPKPVPPAAAPADGLRGPQAAQAAKPLQSPIPKIAPTAFPSALAAAAPDGDSCRLVCARKYYFCLAGEVAEQCPGQWIECRAACSSAERVSPIGR